MNTVSTLNKLSTAMQAIENEHGIDACIAYCNSVYSSSYRTENVLTINDFSADDRNEVLKTLTQLAAEYLAVLDGNELLPVQPVTYSDDECYDFDEFEYNNNIIYPYQAKAKDLVLNGLEFVELVNYKGEDAGYMVKAAANSLMLYKGKYNYV